MKILVQDPADPILEGVAQTLVSIDEDIVVWDAATPINDMLDIHKPDLTICYSKSVKQHTNTKLVLIGENVNRIDADLICVAKGVRISSNLNIYMFIKPAANWAHSNMLPDTNYKTDLFYYSHNTTPEILNILASIEQNYQLKIIGPHRIPLSSYLGFGDIDDIMKFMKSCKIALAFNLDVAYTYASHNVFCATDQNTDLFPSFDKLDDALKYSTEQIDETVQKAYNYIVSDHTYFHRTHNIFTRLGYTEQAEKCLTQLKKFAQTQISSLH